MIDLNKIPQLNKIDKVLSVEVTLKELVINIGFLFNKAKYTIELESGDSNIEIVDERRTSDLLFYHNIIEDINKTLGLEGSKYIAIDKQELVEINKLKNKLLAEHVIKPLLPNPGHRFNLKYLLKEIKDIRIKESQLEKVMLSEFPDIPVYYRIDSDEGELNFKEESEAYKFTKGFTDRELVEEYIANNTFDLTQLTYGFCDCEDSQHWQATEDDIVPWFSIPSEKKEAEDEKQEA